MGADCIGTCTLYCYGYCYGKETEMNPPKIHPAYGGGDPSVTYSYDDLRAVARWAYDAAEEITYGVYNGKNAERVETLLRRALTDLQAIRETKEAEARKIPDPADGLLVPGAYLGDNVGDWAADEFRGMIVTAEGDGWKSRYYYDPEAKIDGGHYMNRHGATMGTWRRVTVEKY